MNPSPLCSRWILVALLLGVSQVGRAQSSADPQIVGVRLGLGGEYKLGCWTPLTVDLLGGGEPLTALVAATAPDSDGVPTTVVSPLDRPVSLLPGQSSTARLLVRIGQSYAPLRVRLFAGGKLIAERKFQVGTEPGPTTIYGGQPATCRMVLEVGPSLGLGELVAEDRQPETGESTVVAHVDSADELPTRWYGYESFEMVLLSTSDPALYRPLENNARIDALREWVRLGGRLIVFCGEEGEEALAREGPLASLVPGKFAEMLPLRDSQPLATYSGSEEPISLDRRLNFRVPRLEGVAGTILAHAGAEATDLPLVVRSPLGLGELVFVGLDFDRPPLRNWKGRTSFLRKVLEWKRIDDDDRSPSDNYGEMYGEDMINKVRQSLDSQFAGVEMVSFGLVAFLVVLYILWIGPGDYYLVTKLLKRPELTWVTFPVIVVVVSLAAYLAANWLKGDQLRVNQVEIVDVDTQSGQVRGTAWTHFFTPKVAKFNLTFAPKFLAGESLDDDRALVSWLGMPGSGIGGMQASGAQTAVFDAGYTFDADRSAMQNLPVQVWSTKTITSRWTATAESSLEINLNRDQGELVAGTVTNRLPLELNDSILLYGRWAFYLGRMKPGSTIEIDRSMQPRTVKTLLTSATAGDETISNTAADGTVQFSQAQHDMARLLKAMMFFNAINGSQYTSLSNRYQPFLDMSHFLAQTDRAVLLCRVNTAGSTWFDGERPLASDADRRWTYYRFVAPVGEEL